MYRRGYANPYGKYLLYNRGMCIQLVQNCLYPIIIKSSVVFGTLYQYQTEYDYVHTYALFVHTYVQVNYLIHNLVTLLIYVRTSALMHTYVDRLLTHSDEQF